MTLDISNASHSDVVTYLRCPKQFYYRVVKNIQAKRRDTKMHLGSLVHRFLQAHKLETEEVATVIGDAYLQAEEEAMTDEELIENKALVAQAVDIYARYVKTWAADEPHMKVLHVEEEFVLEWEDEGRSFRLRVTPDVVEQDMRTGVIWIRDYKTVDSIPQSKDIPTYQQLTYVAAVQAAYPDQQVGFVLDYIKRKVPVQPRLNTTHTKESKAFGHLFVNNVRVVDTTFELLDEFIRTEAPALLDEPGHVMRLQELSEENPFFQRDIIFLNEAAIDNALADVGTTLLQIEKAENFPRVFVANGTQTCDRCEMKPVCFAELRGEEIDSLLAAFYETRVKKNQYEREEEIDA